MYYLSNMDKIILFVKRYKYIFILFIIIIFFFILIGNKKGVRNVEPSPSSVSIATFKNLTPGVSTKEEVLTNLGTALNAKLEGDKETYEYLSSNPNFNTEVVILNNKLSYIKVVYTIKDNNKYEDFISKYGNPEKILYGSNYSVGYILNAFPKKGVAFLYHQKSHNVREAWYFVPTTLEIFMKSFATGYSEKINIIQ